MVCPVASPALRALIVFVFLLSGCTIYDPDLLLPNPDPGGGGGVGGQGGSAGSGGTAGADVVGPDEPTGGTRGGDGDASMDGAGPQDAGGGAAGMDDAGVGDAGPGDAGVIITDGCCQLPNALTSECIDGGLCVPTSCAPGFDNCDGDPATGCEQSLADVAHCGACSAACSLPNVATHTCQDGQCGVAGCEPGYGNCDGLRANGCEAPLTTLSHCGECGVSCLRPNAVSECNGGQCEVIACNSGFASCDMDEDTGCEQSLTSQDHCGSCSNSCDPDDSCNGTQCVISNCPVEAPGFADCDANGTCETPIVHPESASAFDHCGGCSAACGPLPHATVGCTAGVCEIVSCEEGYDDCDGNLANGCETQLGTIDDCGGCGEACSPANATGLCEAGVCQIQSCNEHYANCDGNVSNGCEIHTLRNGSHCNGCSTSCSLGMRCCPDGCRWALSC